VTPLTLVKRCSLIVVISAKTVLKALPQGSLINLSTAKDIDTLTMEIVLFPISKVYVSNRIVKYPFTVSQLFGRDLTHILAICECDFFNIL